MQYTDIYNSRKLTESDRNVKRRRNESNKIIIIYQVMKIFLKFEIKEGMRVMK